MDIEVLVLFSPIIIGSTVVFSISFIRRTIYLCRFKKFFNSGIEKYPISSEAIFHKFYLPYGGWHLEFWEGIIIFSGDTLFRCKSKWALKTIGRLCKNINREFQETVSLPPGV